MPDRIWNVAQYARLSREDGDKAESNSITSQREMIPILTILQKTGCLA